TPPSVQDQVFPPPPPGYTPTARAEPPWDTHPKRWAGLVVAVLAQLLVAVGTGTTAVLLPTLVADLGLAGYSLRALGMGYAVGFGGLLLVGGHLADRIGRRRTLVTGLAGFALTVAVAGFAGSSLMLVLAQLGQGASAALLSTAGLAYVTSAFTAPRERGTAFGLYATVALGGTAVGLLMGGGIAEALSWRVCLLVLAVLAAVLAISAGAIVPDQPVRVPARTDVPGLLLGTTGLIVLAYGLVRLGDPGALFAFDRVVPPPVFAGIGLVLLIAFVALRAKADGGLLPLYVLRDRNRAGALLALLLAGAGSLVVWQYLAGFLQVVWGYPPVTAGVHLLPFALAAAAGALLVSARLQHRYAPRLLIVPGLLLAALGLALLTGFPTGASYFTIAIPGLVLAGAGLGVAFVPLLATATGGTAPHDAGGTAAAGCAAQQLGSAAVAPILGGIIYAVASGRLSETKGIPEFWDQVGPTGALIHTGQLPATLVESAQRANQATLYGYSAAFWTAAGLTLLAAALAGLLVTARAPRP
ncbi:MFS transporter, partial [Streptomyces boluensis]